jgi:hypothetical protein
MYLAAVVMTPALNQFIATNIHSVEEVEIISLLSRSPETFWSGEAIGTQLGLNPEAATSKARELVRRGILKAGESGPVFRYGPASDATKENLTALLASYRDHRISVINAIYSANLTRLRSFADAFKLGGGGNE